MIYKKLLFLGDSITEGFGDQRCLGWAGRIAQKLNKGDDVLWTVSNLGTGGDTVVDGLHRAAPALCNYPSHILLAFGTNDMATIMWPEGQQTKLSLDYSKQSWIRLLAQVKATGCKISVIGTLPVIESCFPFAFVPFDDQDKGYSFTNADQKRYNDMLRDVCKAAGVHMVDLFTQWQGREDLDRLFCDGLHPNTEGYDLMAQQIWDDLSRAQFFNIDE